MQKYGFRPIVLSLLVASLATLPACSTTRARTFETALSHGQCDEAMETLPENDPAVKFLGTTKQTAGTALSYAATGAGYTADVAITVVGGTVMLIALCWPALAQNSGNGVNVCLPVPKALSSVHLPTIGQSTFRETAGLRCPNLTSLSKSMRRVAGCEEEKADLISFEKAKQTLNTIQSTPEFFSCVDPDERSAVRADLSRLEDKIGSAG